MTTDYPLSFESPESKSIEGACYDPNTQQLTVSFRELTGPMKSNLHREYRYPNFPALLWIEFNESSSKGAFFNKHIRPLYQGAPV